MHCYIDNGYPFCGVRHRDECHSYEHAGFNEESEAEYQLDVLSFDKYLSGEDDHESKVEDRLNFEWEDEAQYGKEVKDSRPENNLPLPLHDLLDFELCSSVDTPSLPAEISLLITPTNISNSPFTLPLFFDQSISGSFAEHSSNAVDNAGLYRYNGGRHHCEECTMDFKLEKDLRRHLETAKAHQSTAFQCCCTYKSGRKDNFLKHIARKNLCSSNTPFICSCGYQVESSSPGAIARLLKHIKPCGQRKRGRPKKLYRRRP